MQVATRLASLASLAGCAVLAKLIHAATTRSRVPPSWTTVHHLSADEFQVSLAGGFETTGFTLEEVNKQWRLDHDRVTVLERFQHEWYPSDVFPADEQELTPDLYKTLLAACTQVGGACILERAMAAYPSYSITHPADRADCVIRFGRRSLTFSVEFRALDTTTLRAVADIGGELQVRWTTDAVQSVAVVLRHHGRAVD
jgi:hypothetical protein